MIGSMILIRRSNMCSPGGLIAGASEKEESVTACHDFGLYSSQLHINAGKTKILCTDRVAQRYAGIVRR